MEVRQTWPDSNEDRSITVRFSAGDIKRIRNLANFQKKLLHTAIAEYAMMGYRQALQEAYAESQLQINRQLLNQDIDPK